MVKYAPRKVYIRESGGYVELSYTEFCRCRESDQTYMDKLFIPIQGCLLEVVREQYTDFYRDKERWRYLQKLDTKAEVGTVAELLEEIESENLYQVLVTVDGRTLKIVLLKMQGYSTKEIAPLVHLTTGAIYARLDHLRKKLRKIL